MSWFFGELQSNISSGRIKHLSSIHSTPLHTIATDNFYFATGGINETCFCDSMNEKKENGFCVVGVGLKCNEIDCIVLSQSDWKNILASEKRAELLQQLDEHFAIVVWNGNAIECFTDQMGLRTIYFSKSENGIVFSTRLDWIAQAGENNEIDFAAFGSRWLTFNQCSFKSLVHGIERLGPNGVAHINARSVTMRSKLWSPTFSKITIEEFLANLCAFLNPKNDFGLSLSFGLSGGTDSRFLLSLLMHKGLHNFSLHTFGRPQHPDVSIAKRIAETVHIPHTLFDEPFPEIDTCIAMIKDFQAHTCSMEPASKIMITRYYNDIHVQRKIIIDGGYVEIIRRQLYNRLLLKGKGILKKKLLYATPLHTRSLIPFVMVHKPDIFLKECASVMFAGAESDF